MVIIWASVAVASLGTLVYLAPSYGLDGAFSKALRGHPDSDLQHWFHWLEASFLIGLAMTLWLLRTFRREYGKFCRREAARPSLPR
jgi:hypothetical protein